MPTNNAINSQDPIQVAKGGTGLNTVAQGDLLIASASNTLASLPKDTNATRYLSNTGTNNAPAYAQVNLSNGVTGTLPVGNGGLGITTTPTNGQIPIGNGTNYTAATLTAGSGISLTNAAGSVTIDNTRSAPAMVLLHTITFDNTASSYNLTSYLSSSYETYKIIGTRLQGIGAGKDCAFRVSTDGGSTFKTTGYTAGLINLNLTTNTTGTFTATTVLFGGFPDGTSSEYFSFEAYIYGYLGTTGVECYSRQGGYGNKITLAESIYPSATVNGLQAINTGGGNFTGGKLSIYGIVQ